MFMHFRCAAKQWRMVGGGGRQRKSGLLIENFYQLLRILWAFYLYAAWLTASCSVPAPCLLLVCCLPAVCLFSCLLGCFYFCLSCCLLEPLPRSPLCLPHLLPLPIGRQSLWQLCDQWVVRRRFWPYRKVRCRCRWVMGLGFEFPLFVYSL